jgi:hypothetical protein
MLRKNIFEELPQEINDTISEFLTASDYCHLISTNKKLYGKDIIVNYRSAYYAHNLNNLIFLRPPRFIKKLDIIKYIIQYDNKKSFFQFNDNVRVSLLKNFIAKDVIVHDFSPFNVYSNTRAYSKEMVSSDEFITFCKPHYPASLFNLNYLTGRKNSAQFFLHWLGVEFNYSEVPEEENKMNQSINLLEPAFSLACRGECKAVSAYFNHYSSMSNFNIELFVGGKTSCTTPLVIVRGGPRVYFKVHVDGQEINYFPSSNRLFKSSPIFIKYLNPFLAAFLFNPYEDVISYFSRQFPREINLAYKVINQLISLTNEVGPIRLFGKQLNKIELMETKNKLLKMSKNVKNHSVKSLSEPSSQEQQKKIKKKHCSFFKICSSGTGSLGLDPTSQNEERPLSPL